MNNTITIKKALSNGPSVVFKDVCLLLGGNLVLKKVNFKVESGSIHCIIGPNGGGKTSLLKAMLGQMPHSGSIRMCGSREDWVIGYVPQVLDFDRTLPITIDDFMAITCQNRPAFLGIEKKTDDNVKVILEMVGLKEKRKRILGQLSGGEMQRLLLAQALLPTPDLLVLDEPAAGLDKKGASILHDLLLELKRGGTTIFWIHHDLKEVTEISDEVTCINQFVMFSGKPGDVLTVDRIFDVFSSR